MPLSKARARERRRREYALKKEIREIALLTVIRDMMRERLQEQGVNIANL